MILFVLYVWIKHRRRIEFRALEELLTRGLRNVSKIRIERRWKHRFTFCFDKFLKFLIFLRYSIFPIAISVQRFRNERNIRSYRQILRCSYMPDLFCLPINEITLITRCRKKWPSLVSRARCFSKNLLIYPLRCFEILLICWNSVYIWELLLLCEKWHRYSRHWWYSRRRTEVMLIVCLQCALEINGDRFIRASAFPTYATTTQAITC